MPLMITTTDRWISYDWISRPLTETYNIFFSHLVQMFFRFLFYRTKGIHAFFFLCECGPGLSHRSNPAALSKRDAIFYFYFGVNRNTNGIPLVEWVSRVIFELFYARRNVGSTVRYPLSISWCPCRFGT